MADLEICKRLYYSDLSNSKRNKMVEYLKLLNDQEYSKASEYLNNNNAMFDEKTGVWFIGAELLKYFEQEIVKCMNYVDSLEPLKKVVVDLEGYPEDKLENGTHFISGEIANIVGVEIGAGIADLYAGNELGRIE